MAVDDVPRVERVTAATFYELDVATRPANWPEPERRSPERAGPWCARMRHFIDTDADGCWVADQDGDVVGVAAAVRRGHLWFLSTLAVLPGLQARGLGRQLLDAALTYGPADAPGMICSSNDPRAVRRYRLAGFDLHPAMVAYGAVSRSVIPILAGVREGGADDVELLDQIDRATRGYGHGADHELLLASHPLRIYERGSSRGYAYLHLSGGAHLLAASDQASAATVLWAALEHSDPSTPFGFNNITAEQAWAVDVALAAGMEIHNRGFVALRSMAPPTPYIPSGDFL
ncbi:MAG: GNAT family N-acetyltransferase [Solirubrobacterales bacterium]|nr:GNAT family N-acetyltransferase [Solirubrobacterales bacterium]